LNLVGKSIIDGSRNRKQFTISRQHDARYLGNNRISFFDNSTFTDRPSRGVVIEFRNRRITRSIDFVNPFMSNSDCMGSFRAFDNRNWFVLGHGCSSEIATVFNSNGEWSPNRYYISRFNSIYVSYVGTNLGRLNERSAGKWGIGGTVDAEFE
jgi:hypothetical protein